MPEPDEIHRFHHTAINGSRRQHAEPDGFLDALRLRASRGGEKEKPSGEKHGGQIPGGERQAGEEGGLGFGFLVFEAFLLQGLAFPVLADPLPSLPDHPLALTLLALGQRFGLGFGLVSA